jgi:CHAD domain-containing protein
MLPGVEAGDMKATHRTRVASRRLRELLPLLELQPKAARKLGKRLRKATRQLGAVREADVLQLLTENLTNSGRFGERAMRRVRTDVLATREKARKAFSARETLSDLLRLAKNLEKVARKLDDPGPTPNGRAWQWALDARIAHRAATLKKAVDAAGAIYLSERLHDVRIALKKLRYAVELSADAAAARPGSDLKTLKRAQTLLGRLHDHQVLIDGVRRMQASLHSSDLVVSRDLDALLVALDGMCRRLHARFVRERAAVLEICERHGLRPTAAPRAISSRRAAGQAG